MSIKLTRYDEGHFSSLIPIVDGTWYSHTFEQPVRNLTIKSLINPLSLTVFEIKLNNSEGSFLLGPLHNIAIQDHIITKITYRLHAGTNGRFSCYGTNDYNN